ncbi:RNA polymerase sigma factor [Nocardioides psychrotolerans]|uniref:RNA polymerase sigma-70 factor, sigma-E family n=1 Tax=Nocardioides psychrotolerans TaxID=1005945 RepID=A0A1I3EWU3_9ACTN|nr:SigE family RNA polymerase sigma factor [Nocardioides psychrotolerans]GEP40687.1 RNA polymerase sigma factor [Nocardioides psychrotolerans]SFI03459.1 RNA polymerase sigma-70 factor, sigma-E family [Nocardioides psychrotolerans]
MSEDDGDFSAFASARWGPMVRSAIVLGCTVDQAHDLVQSTLMRCYIKWAKVQRADNRDAYVYRVLLNCYRDSRRRHWWGERPTDTLPDAGVADTADGVAVADAIHRAMRDLSHDHREVVVLRYYAQMTEAQTAQFLGTSLGTVKSRHSRAMAKLAVSPHLSDISEGHLS